MEKQKFIADTTHSSVEFSVKHLGISWVSGRFLEFKLEADLDPENLEGGQINSEVKTESITTFEKNRDNHLKSGDFFDSANHPLATFSSSEIKKISEKEYDISGELTIKGISKPVVLKCEYLGKHESEDKLNIALKAKTIINRHDFNISWDTPVVSSVGGEVEITVNAELVKS